MQSLCQTVGCVGGEFQSLGAVQPKARAPMVTRGGDGK